MIPSSVYLFIMAKLFYNIDRTCRAFEFEGAARNSLAESKYLHATI